MKIRPFLFAGFCITIVFAAVIPVFAGCDSMSGPLVAAAKQALDTGDVNRVLPWVQKTDEYDVNDTFEKCLNIRSNSLEGQDVADQYFFETVLRIHRECTGEPYSGLKPAYEPVCPALPFVDTAIVDKNSDELVEMLTKTIQDGIKQRFDRLMASRDADPDDVQAQRERVRLYENLMNYVETVYNASSSVKVQAPFCKPTRAAKTASTVQTDSDKQNATDTK